MVFFTSNIGVFKCCIQWKLAKHILIRNFPHTALYLIRLCFFYGWNVSVARGQHMFGVNFNVRMATINPEHWELACSSRSERDLILPQTPCADVSLPGASCVSSWDSPAVKWPRSTPASLYSLIQYLTSLQPFHVAWCRSEKNVCTVTSAHCLKWLNNHLYTIAHLLAHAGARL